MNQQFAPKALCEKLVKLGCESATDWFYDKEGNVFCAEAVIWSSGDMFGVPAFIQNDFTGANEQADENCKIVFPEGRVKGWSTRNLDGSHFCRPAAEVDIWYEFKLRMTVCHLGAIRPYLKEAWFKYLERMMRK